MNPMRTLLRLLAAWVCLSVQIAVASPLPTLFTAGIATLDGEHEVLLGVGTGGSRVFLGHRNVPVAVPHDHCACCRLIVSIARDSSEGDHVFEFTNMTPDLRREARPPVARLDLLPEPTELVRILELPEPDRLPRLFPAVAEQVTTPKVALLATDASLRI